MLLEICGNGDTPEEAMANYADKISCVTLVTDPYDPVCRWEYTTPNLVYVPEDSQCEKQ